LGDACNALTRQTSLGELDFDLDLSTEQTREIEKNAAAWALVLDLSQWLIMAMTKATMGIDDDQLTDQQASILRRFWFQRKTQVEIVGPRGSILVATRGCRGARVIKFKLLLA
jgi:hypothetical protein